MKSSISELESEVVRRYLLIQAVWLTAMNRFGTIEECAKETYYVIGEIMDGRSLEDLSCKLLDKQQIQNHFDSNYGR
jgi:hypothetical protein